MINFIYSLGPITAIAHVANSKRHQRLDKILNISTRTTQEISKVVCKKTMSETRAFTTYCKYYLG